jgi:hypothetical protein
LGRKCLGKGRKSLERKTSEVSRKRLGGLGSRKMTRKVGKKNVTVTLKVTVTWVIH